MTENEMAMLTEGLATKADKMRILERQGVTRADIARFLGVRYQQVRNTLEGDKRTGYNPTLDSYLNRGQPDSDDAVFTILKVAPDGSVALSASLIESLPGNIDNPIYAVKTEHGLFITSLEGAMSHLSETVS